MKKLLTSFFGIVLISGICLAAEQSMKASEYILANNDMPGGVNNALMNVRSDSPQNADAAAEDDKPVIRYRDNTRIPAPYISESLKPIIVEYKKGNYVGAMQDLEELLQKEPNNTYAAYYLALCYTQLGMNEQASELFEAIAESESPALRYYSKKALACFENPISEECSPQPYMVFDGMKKQRKKVPVNLPAVEQNSLVQKILPGQIGANNGDEETEAPPRRQAGFDDFVNSSQKFHPAASDQITKERMKVKIQSEEYQNKMQNNLNTKSDASDGAPTNEEIANALNTLSKIGMNPFQLNPTQQMISQLNGYGQYGTFDITNPLMNAMFNGGNLSTTGNSDITRMFLLNQMMQPQNSLFNNYGI